MIGVVGIWVFFWAVTIPFGTANGASNIIDYTSAPLGIMAVAVSMFFIVFGAVAIDDSVIESWIGSSPDYPVGRLVSVQLLKVAIFLGSFSGLYFTVYAITDATYRQQFFTEILRELERAVGVRAVYRAVQDQPARDEPVTDAGRPAPPAPAG